MKILHVIASLDRGGAENHLASLAKYQALDGHCVTVLFMKGEGYWATFLNSFGVKTLGLNLRYHFSLLGIVRFIVLIKKLNPAVIHAHLPPAELLTLVGAKYSKKKYCVTKHTDAGILFSSRTNKLGLFNLFLTRYSLKEPSRVICISRAVYKYFDRLKESSFREKAYVQHYGYDPHLYKQTVCRTVEHNLENFTRNGQLVVVNIARHVPQKRIQRIIEAIAVAKKNKVDIRLIQVGTGPETSKLMLQAKNSGVEDSILWVGATENVDQFFQYSDVFTITSSYEGFGLVLLEAMYNKLPVVTSTFGDVHEILPKIQHEYIHQHIDATNIVDSWVSLLDADKRKNLGVANYSRLTTQFDPLLVYQNTLRFYKTNF